MAVHVETVSLCLSACSTLLILRTNNIYAHKEKKEKKKTSVWDKKEIMLKLVFPALCVCVDD